MMHKSMLFVSAAPAFLIAVITVPLLSRLAPRIGLVDLPRGRKIHDGAIPLTGGIAIFIAFMAPALVFLKEDHNAWAMMAGLATLFVLGLVDDFVDLRPLTKLAAQASAALLMILPSAHFISPGSLFMVNGMASPLVTLPFTCLFLIGMINAINMIDGIDGLAGGTAAVALFWLWSAALFAGRPDATGYIIVFLAAILGFLIFNVRHPWRHRASVFMGNAGSMVLGGAIGIFIVWLAADRGEAGVPLPVVLWAIVVPAFDGMIVVTRRLVEGRSPMTGDRTHGHHLLLDIGLTPALTTALLVILCAGLGGLGILLWQMGVAPSTISAMLLLPCVIHFYLVRLRWKRQASLAPAATADGFHFAEDEAA